MLHNLIINYTTATATGQKIYYTFVLHSGAWDVKVQDHW